METSNKYYEQVWRFFSQTRALYGFYGSVQKIIQLLFLKSISDDASDYPVRSVDDMKVLFKYQKNISEGTIDPQLLRDTFEIVGNTFFGHESALPNAVGLYDFLINGKEKDKRDALEAIKTFNLPKEPSERWELLKNIFSLARGDIRQFSESVTPESISELARELLDISKDDIFADPCCGMSSTFFGLSACKKYYGNDINVDYFYSSMMLSIILKRDNAEFKNEDFFSKMPEPIANKVFCEPPFSMKLNERDDFGIMNHFGAKESDVLSLYLTEKMLLPRGRAVVVTVGKTLFSSTKSFTTVRTKLTESGLRGIVFLPNDLLPGTSVPINMIIIEKGYDGPIQFIDARNIPCDGGLRSKSISKPSLLKISEAFKNRADESGFSKFCGRKEILEGVDSNWNPNQHFIVEDTEKHRSVEEIDKDIQNALIELSERIK